MTGRPYTVNADAMVVAAGAATTIGGLFSQMSAAVGSINVPPGVEGAPQAKLGVASRRLGHVGRAVASQAPVLQNAAEWAAVFEAPSTVFHPLTFKGFPGRAPGLASPFGNVDATNHPGPDFLSGVVSPLREFAEVVPKLAAAVQNPGLWAAKNQKEIRFAVTNTGKLSREAWRDAYASDAGDAGDLDYASGQRSTTLLTLPMVYARLAKAGTMAVKAPGAPDRARAVVLNAEAARDEAAAAAATLRRTAEANADELKKAEAQLKKAQKSLFVANVKNISAKKEPVYAPVRLINRYGTAAALTAAAVTTPVSQNNIEDALERVRDGK